jgi:type 1 glutamine amidotransferase
MVQEELGLTRLLNQVSSIALAMVVTAGCTTQGRPRRTASPTSPPPFKVLVFSKTAGFRHDSIAPGIEAIKELGRVRGFTADATEDSTAFAESGLAQYQAVVFLHTTGDVLDQSQQQAFEAYIGAGGGFVGIHSATDTEYDWPFYGGLVGAYFKGHPAVQPAAIEIVDPAHPSTVRLPTRWTRTDEWYNFRTNPRGRVRVLASLDESSYTGGEMGDHPIAWCQNYEGGRSWYTGGGHTAESFAEPSFLEHLLGGILTVAGVQKGLCAPN